MPRLYLLPGEFEMYPAAIAFAFQIMQLKAVPYSLDQLMARASSRVDARARKRIVAPPATTVGTGGIAAGATTLPLTSTFGFDNGAEQAVIIGSGGTQETVPVSPGGVKVSSWGNPYPGTVKLAQGATYSHAAGEAVQGCYQEVSTVGSSSSSDAYSESLWQLSQAAQVAVAHQPQMEIGSPTRVIFLKCYPIIALYKLEHTLPTGSDYADLGTSGVAIQPASGYLRLPLGSYVLPEGLFRTTYTAGYVYPDDAIQEATAWYAADELQTMVSRGAYEVQSGKTRAKYAADTSNKTTKSTYEQRAEEIIDRGYRRTV